MLRQKHGWTVTVGAAAALGLGIWTLAGHMQARVAEVQHDREAQGLSLFEFQRLYDKGETLVVDVRDRASYERGRIAGAVHVSTDALERDGSSLPDVKRRAQGRLVVTYCSCPTEASSLRAARTLAAGGVPARALVGGYPAWVEAGGRIEHGTPPR